MRFYERKFFLHSIVKKNFDLFLVDKNLYTTWEKPLPLSILYRRKGSIISIIYSKLLNIPDSHEKIIYLLQYLTPYYIT